MELIWLCLCKCAQQQQQKQKRSFTVKMRRCLTNKTKIYHKKKVFFQIIMTCLMMMALLANW